MNEPTQTPWYLDKPFLAVIIVPLLNLLAKKLGVQLDTDAIVAQVAAVVAFVVMHKWKGAKMAQAAADATAAQATILNETNKAKQLELSKATLEQAFGTKVIDVSGGH